MELEFVVIIVHQLLFQGMFYAKNRYLGKKLGIPIRGNNPEALASIAFIVFFICVSLVLSLQGFSVGHLSWIDKTLSFAIAIILLGFNLTISAFSLMGLRDSWRVGIVEEQKPELVETGIYRFSRNPYFLSYIVMFFSYAVLLQSLILFLLSGVGFFFIHRMITKEEQYLQQIHGDQYLEYSKRVPRYLIY